MSRNDSGDSSPRLEETIEEEMLSPEDGEETSNISESLFKGIISEEDIEEVVSGMQDDIQIVKEGDLHGTVPRADIDRDSSGEEASVFEDIGEEDFTAEQSGCIRTSNRGTGLFNGLCTGGSGITDEIPLIRTSGKELDDVGSLPAGFGSSHVEDDACVKFISQAEEMESRMGEESKEELSLFAGIARDCGTCSEEGPKDVGVVSMAQETRGDEKVEVGAFSPLTDDKEDIEQNLILPQNSPNRLHESLCSESVSTASLEMNSKSVEDKTSPTGQMTENHESYGMLGEEKTPLANAPKPQVRRRGRATRELGALLMDSNAGRRGMRDSELQGPYTVASAKLSEREGADSIGPSDRIAMLSSDRMSEVRVTRSQALGRSGTKDGQVDSKVETITPPDTSTKRTGKRSVTRGGRPGWGNANESCPHNLETVANVEEKASSEGMGEDVPDVHIGAQLAKSALKGKPRGKGKKAPTMVGTDCVSCKVEPEEKTYSSTSPVSSGPENIEGSEPVLNPSEEMNASSRQESVQEEEGASCTPPHSEEKKALDVDGVVEDKKVGKRRSNRQTTKTAKKAEEGETACGESKKSSKGRKPSENGRNKTEEVLDVHHVNPQANSPANVSEIYSLPENVTIKRGDSGTDTAMCRVPPRRGTGRNPAKEKQKADSVNVVKQKKGLAVSRRCSVGKGKSGGKPRVKQYVSGLTVARSDNEESEREMAMKGAEEDGGCSRGVVSSENDSVGAGQGSDKNASSITGDIKDVCQDQKKLPRISSEFETSDRPWSQLDSKDDFVRTGNSETCNSSGYVNPGEQFSEGNHRNLVGSSWTTNLVSVTSQEKDATIEGTGATVEEGDNGSKSPASQGNGKNTGGDTSRDTRDDIGYATSCDSLVKREGDVVKMGEGAVPSVGLSSGGGCDGLILTTQTEEVALSPGTGVSGQTKTRQRKGTKLQLAAKLVTQSSRKGKKGSTKNVSASSAEIPVPLEEALSSRSNKKKFVARKDKKKSALEISGEHVNHLQGVVSIPATGKASDAADAVRSPVQEEGLHEADKQSVREAEDKLAYSGSEVETTERQKIGASADDGLPFQSTVPPELVSDKCETSTEAHRVDGAKPSRKPNGRQKKPSKTAVPAVEAIPSGAKGKGDARRSTKAKGTTIKALLSVKGKTKQVASEVKGGASDVHAGGRLRNDVDAAHSLEVVQNSVNVESVEGSRVREEIDSPDNAATGEDMSSGVTQGDRSEDVERRAGVGVSEDEIPRKSWVLCDDCNKWRCIPVELADEIDNTNAKWSCRDNPNPDFANCSIPQEKSNAEINAELQISEFSGSEEDDDNDGIESKLMDIGIRSGENKPAVWKMIRRNIFQHRRAKTQASDEVMICQCTPPEDGGVGCGDNCLNRVLNIECVQEYCPCGEACSNQQFQKRMYAPVATFRCGKKGFGLKVLKNIHKDSFLIEYVGEVLDVGAFEKRQEEYARIGQKHFYFMTLNSTEVIDACSKGNLGRFINHSCEPNCKTEKWMVNGEVCIGLFAIRDIAEGEEVTFDYNYVRVRGASAKKCKCGSSQCRGFIGTDSETPRDEIVESDSEEDEDLEPVMIVNSDEEENHVLEDKVTPPKKQRDDKVYQEPTRPSRIKRKLVPSKEEGRVVKRMKTTGSSTVKKLSSSNPKGLTVDTGAGRHESGRALSSDVQDKLDDLLDDTGGLKKKKDVPRQYLRLLLLSTASGDNEKESSGCSVRDVSLLLEALLRTWSRSVLSDIMKNNGLRVLHTFIKQLRWQWDKTPILRKLMKVLEHLSSDRVGVLTQNMINSAAPSRRVESFSESLFELTRHRDPEVCVMARRFRYKWIPPRPPVYERLPERPPQPPLKSVSPLKSTNQAQPEAQSPRKQSPNIAGLVEGTDVSKVVKGPLSVNGIVANGTAPRLSQGETPGPSGCDPQIVAAQNVKRKRVSRWDAPAKVAKGTYEPAVEGSATDVQGVNSTSSVRQTSVSAVPPVHSAAGGQSQSPVSREPFSKKQRQLGPNRQNGSATSPLRSEAFVSCSSGKQGAEEMSVVPSNAPGKLLPQKAWQPDFPGQSASWPPATAVVNQDPERLPFGVTSGQPPIHPGAPAFIQGRSEPVYGFPTQPHLPQVHGPFPVTPAIPQCGPPPHFPTGVMAQHLAPHQVSASNGVIPGGVGFPTTVYPGCPPLHMCLPGPPLQSVNGMAPNVPLAPYPQGVHYGHWVPAVGMSHFAGPPAFPLDESRRCLPQPLWQNTTSRGHELGGGIDQRIGAGTVVHLKGDLPSNCVQTAASVEAEPPVPGLSPPLSTTPNTQDSAGVANPCTREVSQERKIPVECRDSGWRDENWGVQETSRDRGHGPPQNRAGIPDVGETGNGFLEEHWDDPESQIFRDNVFSLVKTRVQRHKLKARDVDKFCSKLADVIVRKEVARCVETRNRGCEKRIVRSKLEQKLESYVDREVENFSRRYDRNHKSGDR
ncbi:hypothetical protein R1sor_021422 [Riccia sorocarpa]|uniref:Histone-lysine N-methyltransferase ASHH2 n=1 Tax=Riccia sorocarpa TaxID=122646 RepID=A0ABD3GIN8_9MARC